MTTIEKLYYGRIRPHEKNVDPESRFSVLQDLLLASDEIMTLLLTGKCWEEYEVFKDIYDELYELAQKEAFADGFSLGLRFGIEGYGRGTEYERNGEN